MNITDPISTLVILGSGLAGCYSESELTMLDGAGPMVTEGHPVRIGMLKSCSDGLLVAIGRRHFYEGESFDRITEIVRSAAALGARRLVVTNAAGGLDPRFVRGDIMLIDGLIAGFVAPRLAGGRSPAAGISSGFDSVENDRVVDRALERGLFLKRGIYAGVPGPSYETRAEIRMLRRIGASVVGMSTVAETLAARQLGMRVIGLSLVTNVASDTIPHPLDHSDVLSSSHDSLARMRIALDAAV